MDEFSIKIKDQAGGGSLILSVQDEHGTELGNEYQSSFSVPIGVSVEGVSENSVRISGDRAHEHVREVTATVMRKKNKTVEYAGRASVQLAPAVRAGHEVGAAARAVATEQVQTGQVSPRLAGHGGTNGVTKVSLQRSVTPQTEDEVLWVLIRHSTNNLGFENYTSFMESILCGEDTDGLSKKVGAEILNGLRLPFPGVDPYRQLKAITEVFLQVFSGVQPGLAPDGTLRSDLFAGLAAEKLAINPEDRNRVGNLADADAQGMWDTYTRASSTGVPPVKQALPYLSIIRAKLGESVVGTSTPPRLFDCMEILQEKLLYPCFVELIWSYWHEEGMLAQTMLKLSDRFQNRRSTGGRDPLANLEIDPLRSLNNFFWGYIQDEQHRLSVRRRAHEYDHHYGMSLHGKAVGDIRTADRRSKFIESFHNLLHECAKFHRQDDDTTVIADGFRVLNAVKETHYVVAQGAHNQFGDLPVTSRQEMLIEQWLLGRPEMREFLGGRVMVPYPEAWMDRVDTMKTLQGWTDVSVVHFRDLAVYGEQILLSVRYGAWSKVNDPNKAANWARYWRPEIQSYLHAYRTVTGVDLTSEVTAPQEIASRYLPPSVHLRNRLMEAARR